MKNVKRNTIILTIITIITLVFILKDDFFNIINNLKNANAIWIIIAILCMLGYWFLKNEGLYLLAREYNNSISRLKLFQQTIITHFFSGITPFSTGGEPVAIYMLKKSGLKLANSTSVIIQNFIMYQISLVTYGIIAIIFNYNFHFFVNVSLLRKLVVLGFTINLFVALFLLLIGFSTKFNKIVMKKIISIFSKLKIVKNKELTIEKYQIKLDEFHESAKLFRKKKVLFVKSFFVNFLSLGVYYIIPLFIIFALRDYSSLNVATTLVSSAYVLMIASFVPIPGGSGGIEYGFLQFFGTFITGPLLTSVLIVWRFITYYFGMILGAILFNVYGRFEQ